MHQQGSGYNPLINMQSRSPHISPQQISLPQPVKGNMPHGMQMLQDQRASMPMQSQQVSDGQMIQSGNSPMIMSNNHGGVYNTQMKQIYQPG